MLQADGENHPVEARTVVQNPTVPAVGGAEPRTLMERVSRLAVFYELTKPGIAGYVMVTAGVAYLVAAGGTAQWTEIDRRQKPLRLIDRRYD